MRVFSFELRRKLRAGLLTAGVLWVVAVTAGSDTAAAAFSALRASLPLGALRWELGDLWTEDSLSPAVVMTISESPLLLAARPAVAELWEEAETPEAPPEDEQELVITPVEETPLDAPSATDNGVPAKTLVPTDPSGYTVCGRTYISNSTDYSLSIPDLQETFSTELTAEEPQILIIHSHGSEAYTPTGDAEVVWSGDHRTTDSRYNVVKVGDVMAEVFGEAGISVLHDRTLYDYPSYTGAYDRSLSAIQSYLAQYPSIHFILDIHRDAIEDGEGHQYKVVSAVDDTRTAAQMTLVVGSDGSGLTHPNWMENLRLAVAIQEQTLSQYPTLMRPVLLRNSRYNQHATTGSLLVEVGAAGNSPEEAALAGRLLAEEMVEVLEARSK
ncbi:MULTISPECIES: stage II sporulation protein P [Eubacteriales]|uniref:stage II sporulation protein P n=1 Tax=Eubacteriales TaxID=186802 RepID=UPI002A9C26E8|nr:stage II sporulation protein P [Dysosmobacter sp.]MDY5612642.1 stage II sporulation protein P [Dysosmobacter sp.]